MSGEDSEPAAGGQRDRDHFGRTAAAPDAESELLEYALRSLKAGQLAAHAATAEIRA